MAFDPQAYSPQEFQLAFQNELDNSISPDGTIGAASTYLMQKINVDSVTFPELNPVQTLDVRSGVGRTLKATDTFTCNKSIYKEISFTGIADTTVCPLLIQNLTTTAAGTGPVGYGIVSNWTPPELLHGAASSLLKTLTVAFCSPETTSSIIFPGCVLTKLSFTAGIGEENGRVKMSGTFATGYLETHSQAIPTSMAAYGSTFYYLSQMSAKTTFAGITDCVIDSLTIDLENPTQYGYFQGANGDPTSIHRGIPRFIATAMATVKYDSKTAPLQAALGAGLTTAEIELSDDSTWASTTANSFALKAAKGIVTSFALSDNVSQYIDVGVTMVADDAAQDLFEIVL